MARTSKYVQRLFKLELTDVVFTAGALGERMGNP